MSKSCMMSTGVNEVLVVVAYLSYPWIAHNDALVNCDELRCFDAK